MGLAYIGPVAVRVRKPAFNWTSNPTSQGQRAGAFTGVMQWGQAQQLSELVDNPVLQQTEGPSVGVPETLWFDDVLLAQFSGRYLLQNFDLLGDWQWAGHGIDYPVAFALRCVFLGANRQIVVAMSSRQLGNDFGLTGVSVFVDPFWNEDPTGAGSLLVSVAGSLVAREYEDI